MKLNNLLRITFLIYFLITNISYSQTPSIEWQKSFGGSAYDFLYSIIQTTDGGYIIAGNADSNDGDVIGNHGYSDYWVLKMSSSGNVQWKKCFGGTFGDLAQSIIQTTDGGYIIAGISFSNNGDVTGNHGNADYWIVKISSTGIIEWQKSLGGTDSDYAYSIIQSLDNGYIVTGFSYSNNGDVTGNHGDRDYWIVKLNSTGIIQWQKSLGGTGDDYANSLIQTTDGGYIIAGSSSSNNGNVTGNHGGSDYWIVKLNSTGIIQWQKSLGGTNDDYGYSIAQTLEGGYIIAGISFSNNGDVTGNHGSSDYWIVKLSATGILQWQKSLGGTNIDQAMSIIQLLNGSYIVSGTSYSNNGDLTGNHGGSDCWIVKLSSTGIIQWQKSLGGTSYEQAMSVIQTIGGGYAIVGSSSSNDGDLTGNNGGYDYWVVKLSAESLSTNLFIENNIFTISPNPTKENITLQLNYFSPNQEITITNILGKTIHNQKLEGLTTSINTSNLASGIYFLNLSEGSNKIVKKFIKE